MYTHTSTSFRNVTTVELVGVASASKSEKAGKLDWLRFLWDACVFRCRIVEVGVVSSRG